MKKKKNANKIRWKMLLAKFLDFVRRENNIKFENDMNTRSTKNAQRLRQMARQQNHWIVE